VTQKTSVSGAGDMGFKSLSDQISHTLPITYHRCNLDVWSLAQSHGDGHRSLVTLERVLSEYNEDFIFCKVSNFFEKREFIASHSDEGSLTAGSL